MSIQPNIEPWFWETIDRARPSENRLREALAVFNNAKLEQFAAFFQIAADYTRDPWDGPFIQSVGGQLSEDDVNDLNDWIVGQGFNAWKYARSPDADWEEIFRLATEPNTKSALPECSWHTPHPLNSEDDWGASIRIVIVETYEERFSADFYDALPSLQDKYDSA